MRGEEAGSDRDGALRCAARAAAVVASLALAACSLFGASLDNYSKGDAAPDPTCLGAGCEERCSGGTVACDGRCVTLEADPRNCGTCGKACATGEACVAGACSTSCPAAQTICDGLCFDLTSDARHCGNCSVACKPGEVCGNSVCSLTCPAGQKACGPLCVDTQSSFDHCGDCNRPCGPNQECAAGSCRIACKTLLNQAITDPWGTSWDGLERASSTFANAQNACAAIGGRLPTASELYRVSAKQSATVGQTIHVNNLWSIVPHNATQQVRLRLSDAVVGVSTKTSLHNYRCVCPAPQPSAYTGDNCFGPVGQACFTFNGQQDAYNVDMVDRPPLAKGSAIWECAFARGHLPDFATMVAAMQQGLPNGSNAYLQTADDARYDLNTVVRWQNVAPSGFKIGTVASWGGTTSLRPFRCVGPRAAVTPHPATVPDEFVGRLGGLKSETKDTPAATWPLAHDACWNRGGHVPTATELAEMIQKELPGGTNITLWTHDQVGFDDSTSYAKTHKWTGVAPNYGYAYSADMAWEQKIVSNPFRCIYYPVSTTYAGPDSAACSGGCFELSLPGMSGAKMWLDTTDRAPAGAHAAIDACRLAGGKLAGTRDYLEAVRHGLPNGSNAAVYSSDFALGETTAGNPLQAMTVTWQGTSLSFNDLATASGWSAPDTANGYRCVWTNEVR